MTEPNVLPGSPPAPTPAVTPAEPPIVTPPAPVEGANVAPPPAVEPPVAAPAVPPVEPTPPAEPPSGLTEDFSKLAAEFEAEDVGEAPAKTEPPKVTEPVTPPAEPPKAQEPVPPVTPPGETPPTPPAVTLPSEAALEEEKAAKAAAEAAAQTPPVKEPVTPAEVIPPMVTPEQVAADRKLLTDHWAEKYKITEEEGVELIDKPHEVLPRAMANLHVGVLEDLSKTMVTLLPQLIAKELKVVETRAKDKTDFYAAWPKLDDAKYTKTVERMGDLYTQNNPGVPREQFIKEVGAAAMIAFKIPPDLAVVTPPGAPPVITPPVPFVPAQPGGGTPPAAPKADPNMYETLSIEFDQDDG